MHLSEAYNISVATLASSSTHAGSINPPFIHVNPERSLRANGADNERDAPNDASAAYLDVYLLRA